MKLDLLTALEQARADKRPAALITRIEDGRQSLWVAGEWVVGPAMPLNDDIAEALRLDKSRNVELDGQRYFLQIHNPPLRLIVIGAVHISQVLARLGAELGYSVTVIDPRRAWATDERFPGITLDRRWPDEALEELAPDARTAVVTLTHDPKLDDPALQLAVPGTAFYVGALGSKKTHAKRVDRLTEAGIAQEKIARLHAPVGLNIGAVSPAEIAVAIMAEITLALRGAKP